MAQQSYDNAGLGALLDLSFNKFITLSVIKLVYVLGLVVIGLGYLGAVVSSLRVSILNALVVLVVGAIIGLFYVVFFRIWLELIVVIFRIGENTGKLAEAVPGTGGAAGAVSGNGGEA